MNEIHLIMVPYTDGPLYALLTGAALVKMDADLKQYGLRPDHKSGARIMKAQAQALFYAELGEVVFAKNRWVIIEYDTEEYERTVVLARERLSLERERMKREGAQCEQ